MQTSRTVKTSKFYRLICEVLIICLLYLYIFQPQLISKYIFLSIEILIFFIFQCQYRWRPLIKFYRGFSTEVNILILIVLYSTLRDLLSGNIVYSDRMFYFAFQSFFFSNFLVWKFKHRDIRKYLLYTGILASFITIAMMVNSTINSYITSFMEKELINYENFEIRYRAYGFSENLTFTYSYVLGICASICLLKVRHRLIYAVPFVSCLVGVAFNARIGFMPIILTLCYVVLYKKGGIKDILKLAVGIFLVSYAMFYIWKEQIEIYKETSWSWISSFFYDISDFLFGTSYLSQESTLNTLTSSFIVFPEGVTEWIFGSGKSLFLETAGQNSDIGYILQLNYGGIIFISLICFFMAYTIIRYWNMNKLSWFTLIYAASLILLNYKGFIFAGTPGARFIFLLYVYGLAKNVNAKKFIY